MIKLSRDQEESLIKVGLNVLLEQIVSFDKLADTKVNGVKVLSTAKRKPGSPKWTAERRKKFSQTMLKKWRKIKADRARG